MLSLRNVFFFTYDFIFLYLELVFSSLQWFLWLSSFVSQIFIHRILALISQHQIIMVHHLGYQCGFLNVYDTYFLIDRCVMQLVYIKVQFNRNIYNDKDIGLYVCLDSSIVSRLLFLSIQFNQITTKWQYKIL